MSWLDKISFSSLIVIALILGLAPFSAQPHLLEKLNMLQAGVLVRPIDVFDLVMHSSPIILLLLKFVRYFQIKNKV